MSDTPMTGTIWRAPGLRIERVGVEAGTRLRGHGHAAPHLCYVLRGGFEERERGRRRAVERGTLRASPAGDEHDLAFGTDTTCLLALFEGEPLAVTPPAPRQRLFVAHPRVRRLARELASELVGADPPSPFAVAMVALELLAAAAPAPANHASPPLWLRRVRERIREAPGEQPTPSRLAEETGYHPVYVARLFRRHYGVGLGQYARLARAEHARAVLLATDAPLARVALRAGYADQSHMTRELRRVLGVTPLRLRRRGGGEVEVASLQDEGGAGA